MGRLKHERIRSRGLIGRLYPLLLILLGIILIVGGLWLAVLGGSLYYLLAGAALVWSAGLFWRRRREGRWVYAGIVAISLGWAISQSGFSGWQIVPQMLAWLVLGTWMATSSFERTQLLPAETSSRLASVMGWRGFGAAIALAILLGAGLHALDPDNPDPIYQAGQEARYPARSAGKLRPADGEWRAYGNDEGGTRFSPLDQITPANVSNLKLAWKASLATSELSLDQGLETTPIMIGDTLYACNGVNDVFAIDAETGKERWRTPAARSQGRTCRGVAYYRVSRDRGLCAERIITTTGDAALVALDAKSGALCPHFGEGGRVNLLDGMSAAPRHYYYVTSAPAVVRGKIVLGGMVLDGQYWGEPSGVIRAFDAVTGKLAWAWDMGAPDRRGPPPAGQTYTHSTPNSWGPISADEQLGLVYLPIGNATPDFFGGRRRPIDDKYSSSVIALDASTGRLRWSYQTVRHDLWDYDVAAQPTLVDIPLPGGKAARALVQATKTGDVFVLDRATGQPLRNVIDMPVPQEGSVPQERLSPTQPFSVAMPSFRGPVLRERDMWGITPLDSLFCRIKFKRARYQGIMTPPGITPWISLPGFVGGMDWGGVSIDVDHNVMIVNSSVIANISWLYTRARADAANIRPANDAANGDLWGPAAQVGTPYAAYTETFKSPLGLPCHEPPFGRISAVDLTTGKLIWSRELGMAGKSVLGLPVLVPVTMGTPTTGGSMTTRGGLTFIAATQDRILRAFEARTGALLWSARLPRGGFATPMSYISRRSGRQFLLVAAGGSHGLGETGGAELVAYALPAKSSADNKPSVAE
ncbi:membrane-bound PQQ-dependent dehydrogenase, glucose/quinate/shikimate family [Novosphingobium album (ex Liu et al. 2023)]|uniref:Membrane-bound PQQ-dependent dehydrogenase, glucose/quinate/shikimate family n=1 Tax=Novosphingobium album (ex Liu et al. 2023) TaxID=3031130 RepID=A0ABT5WT05_9SPHN|nr:membrane-bound PQQ-dependent dehydrogenase, glucose/quinate/shikimate family [Novosphingobium album (ex Liu et al. 2023)]MDE8653178.1 membrane-bound PQQ-dependent dehydrogenase, glucose/quinate/shikimate family [Novosphingobium album (ex Liu et al. 2023)]